MSALEWRKYMRAVPVLRHADGMVVAVLGERVVVFPSEPDARFFVEAYTDVQTLADEVATLRQWIDEGALMKARTRARELEAENATMHKAQVDEQALHTTAARVRELEADVAAAKARQGVLEAANAELAEAKARLVIRAKILASALKRMQK